jgi:23S rRNA (adenine2503-C2)-methyltransferase
MNLKPSLYDYTQAQLKEIVKPQFRAKQIYGWLYHNYAQSFDEMKNIPKTLKEELAQTHCINPLKIIRKEESSDGT